MKRILTLFLSLSLTVINAFAVEYEIVNTVTLGWYKSYIVNYRSVNADMTGTETVSGVLTLPAYGTPVCLLLDNHHTITQNAEAPSMQGASTAGALFSLQYAIAATDYVGYGASADKTHPYLCHRQNAQNSIDMALVAWDIIEKEGIQMTHRKLLNMGYSQGGGVAMAVHREMEQNPDLAEKTHFAGSWCGDGPYDVKGTIEDVFTHPEQVAYPLGFPMIINGFLSGAPAELKGDLKFSDFITDQMLDAGLETWLAEKQLDNDEINARMKAVVGDKALTVSDIFKPAMGAIDAPLTQKILEFAESNSLCTGWTPTYPIKLIHMKDDPVVPVLNAERAIEGLQLTTDQYVIADVEDTHAGFGTTFFMSLIAEFDEFLQSHPDTGIDTPTATYVGRAAKRLEGDRIVIEHDGKRYNTSGTAISTQPK